MMRPSVIYRPMNHCLLLLRLPHKGRSITIAVHFTNEKRELVQTTTRKGWTALLRTASCCHLDAMKLLVGARANMEAANNCGQEPRCGVGRFEYRLISQSVMDRRNEKLS